MPNKAAYYLPNGPKNLVPLFPGVDFSRVDKYYLQLNGTTETDIDETPATGRVNITNVGDNGDSIQGLVNDPSLGSISLGVYTKLITDTSTTILAASVAAIWNGNAYGYVVSSSLNAIIIQARPGLGASINGGLRLSIVITPYSPGDLLISSSDKLLINSSDKIII